MADNDDVNLKKLDSGEARRVFAAMYGRLIASTAFSGPLVICTCGVSGGEGASTVAAGLAAAAVAGRRKVLIIDGNVHHPSLTAAYGASGGAGLADWFLEADVEIDRFLKPGPQSNLWVLAAGSAKAVGYVGFDPLRFTRLLGDFRLSYQFIVIDGPALLAHPESTLYAPLVDRVLVVARAGATRGPVIKAALDRLSGVPSEHVEIVLNRRTFFIPESVYRRL